MNSTGHTLNVAYSDNGKGMPVVFLHAFPLNRAMWVPQITALCGRYRTIAVDLRGHGQSPLSQVYTVEDLASDVHALLDRLSIERAAFVGLSMGGYVLMAFYRRFADRVVGLILADTRAQADSPEAAANRVAMIRTAESDGAGAIADIMVSRLLSPDSLKHRPELVDSVRAMIVKTPVTTITADLRAMLQRPDSSPLLDAIRCPTLILVGELDRGTPPADAHYMAERIRGATWRIIPAAGHLSNLEQPDLFNDALRSFLDGIQR